MLTAMVTPFNETGDIDYDEVSRIVEMLIETGSDGIVVAGTTGESPTLSTEEKLSLFKYVTKVVNGRAKVIAGTGSNATAASAELTKKATECGVDGIMLVVPYYNKPSQEGLYEHFRTIAEATHLPVMLYNIPGRTSANLTVDTVVRLAEIPNIASVKEASGDFVQAAEIIRRTPDHFRLYSGDDKNTLPLMSIGGYGVVSVASHLIGTEIQAMIRAFVSGNTEEAQRLHVKWLDLFENLFIAPNPVPVKFALSQLGYGRPAVRLPLTPLTASEQTAVNELLKAVKTIRV